MSNMFENVKSDSNTHIYNPSSASHTDLTEYQNVVERMEVASRNMSESAAAFLDLLIEDDGSLKDYPHKRDQSNSS